MPGGRSCESWCHGRRRDPRSHGNPVRVIPAGHVGVKGLLRERFSATPRPRGQRRLPLHEVVKMSVKDAGGQGTGRVPSGRGYVDRGFAPLPARPGEGGRHLQDDRSRLPGDRRPSADPVSVREVLTYSQRRSTPPSATRSQQDHTGPLPEDVRAGSSPGSPSAEDQPSGGVAHAIRRVEAANRSRQMKFVLQRGRGGREEAHRGRAWRTFRGSSPPESASSCSSGRESSDRSSALTRTPRSSSSGSVGLPIILGEKESRFIPVILGETRIFSRCLIHGNRSCPSLCLR